MSSGIAGAGRGEKMVMAVMAMAGHPPYLSWASNTVVPGETLMLSGSGLSAGCAVHLSQGRSDPVVLAAAAASATSLMATVPASFPPGAFTARAVCGGGASNALVVGAPRVWWWLGDCGNV